MLEDSGKYFLLKARNNTRRNIGILAPLMKKMLSKMAIENCIISKTYTFFVRDFCINTATLSFKRRVVTGLPHAVSIIFIEANQSALAYLCGDLETCSYALIIHVGQLVCHRTTVGGVFNKDDHPDQNRRDTAKFSVKEMLKGVKEDARNGRSMVPLPTTPVQIELSGQAAR